MARTIYCVCTWHILVVRVMKPGERCFYPAWLLLNHTLMCLDVRLLSVSCVQQRVSTSNCGKWLRGTRTLLPTKKYLNKKLSRGIFFSNGQWFYFTAAQYCQQLNQFSQLRQLLGTKQPLCRLEVQIRVVFTNNKLIVSSPPLCIL